MWHVYCNRVKNSNIKSNNEESRAKQHKQEGAAEFLHKDRSDVKQFVLGFYIVDGRLVGGAEHL